MNLADIKTMKKQVEFCLRNFPETRNSDVTLLIKLWEHFHGVRGAVEVSRLYDLPREDGVKRVRAQFNELGKYYPTDWRIAKARGIEEDAWRVSMGYPKKAATENPKRSESYMDPQRVVNQPRIFPVQ